MVPKIAYTLIVLSCVLATASHAQNAEGGKAATSNGLPIDFLTVDEHASNLIQVDPQANWGQYRTYRFAPAVYEPEGSRHNLSPRDALKVTATVDRSLQKTFKQSFEENSSVLTVRPIITGVKRTNTFLNIVGFAAIQAPISFGAATVRYELYDGGTGKQIGIISCRRAARPWNVYPWDALQNFEALGQGSVILKGDSRRLRKDLERLSTMASDPGRGPVTGAE